MPGPADKSQAKQERSQRLAEALRENLKRRKDQRRGRQGSPSSDDGVSSEDGDPDTS